MDAHSREPQLVKKNWCFIWISIVYISLQRLFHPRKFENILWQYKFMYKNLDFNLRFQKGQIDPNVKWASSRTFIPKCHCLFFVRTHVLRAAWAWQQGRRKVGKSGGFNIPPTPLIEVFSVSVKFYGHCRFLVPGNSTNFF